MGRGGEVFLAELRQPKPPKPSTCSHGAAGLIGRCESHKTFQLQHRQSQQKFLHTLREVQALRWFVFELELLLILEQRPHV